VPTRSKFFKGGDDGVTAQIFHARFEKHYVEISSLSFSGKRDQHNGTLERQ